MDARVSNFEYRVAAVLASFLNRETGETFVGRETIARHIPGASRRKHVDKGGADVRSVQRAIGAIEGFGYLLVERPKGRGNSNIYRMAFPENRTPESGFKPEKETHESCFTAENRTRGSTKQDSEPPKTGLGSLPNLKEPYSLTLGSPRRPRGNAYAVIAARLERGAFRGGSSRSTTTQNQFGQAELNRLVELICNTCSVTTAQAWEALLEQSDVDVDDLRRKMRRGQLDELDLRRIVNTVGPISGAGGGP